MQDLSRCKGWRPRPQTQPHSPGIQTPEPQTSRSKPKVTCGVASYVQLHDDSLLKRVTRPRHTCTTNRACTCPVEYNNMMVVREQWNVPPVVSQRPLPSTVTRVCMTYHECTHACSNPTHRLGWPGCPAGRRPQNTPLPPAACAVVCMYLCLQW
jgi:hypothetical protein